MTLVNAPELLISGDSFLKMRNSFLRCQQQMSFTFHWLKFCHLIICLNQSIIKWVGFTQNNESLPFELRSIPETTHCCYLSREDGVAAGE